MNALEGELTNLKKRRVDAPPAGGAAGGGPSASKKPRTQGQKAKLFAKWCAALKKAVPKEKFDSDIGGSKVSCSYPRVDR